MGTALALLVVEICLIVFLIRLPVGRIRPGKHRFPGSKEARIWLLHLGLLRVLHFPLWKNWIYGLSTLRWVAFRAMGCRNSFDLDTSADALVLDASLHRFGPGCQLGAGVIIGGHTLSSGVLRLEGVELSAGVQLHTRVHLGPGTRIEDEVEVGPYTQIAGRCRIGARTVVASNCMIALGVDIGRDVVLGQSVVLEPRVQIGDGARVAGHTVIPAGTQVEPGARFPEDGE